MAYGDEGSGQVIRTEYWIFIVKNTDGKLGYYDIPSGYYQKPMYDGLFDTPDRSAPILACKDGFWGYIDRATGETVIPFMYTATTAYSDFANGYALIANRISSNDDSCMYRYYLIDQNGNAVNLPSGITPASGAFGSKKTVIISGMNKNGEYGFGLFQIEKGITVDPVYEDIWAGDCNYFCFRDQDEKIGVIDADGNIVVSAKFRTNGSPISYLTHKKSTTSILTDGYYTVYNENGKPVYIFIDNEKDKITVFDTEELCDYTQP